ncbi:MAG TPA: fused MFS/spermidine synthase [Chitinivibrionales bacterium]|nr:fused MFS/spermidine synthase [Chitinivibrionales bacterium]
MKPLKNSGNALITLFFISGVCNLVYEIVWARMFNLVFGVTVFAVSAVLAAFMLGLAIGGIFFGRISEKTKNTGALFSLIHAGIFMSVIVMLLAFPLFQAIYLGVFKLFNPNFIVFRIVLFALSMLFMVIPTTLMGATFPVACKLYVRHADRLGADMGLLYSVNTLGSVLGCLATIFLLLGALGMKGCIVLAALTDLAVALAVPVVIKPVPAEVKST